MTDYTLEDTLHIPFSTKAFATDVPTVLSGTPVVSAYENASLTQITAGITLGVDHDSVVGLNMLTIDATASNGYEAGKDYSLVITTGTVDGVSVVSRVVGEFTLERSAAALKLDIVDANIDSLLEALVMQKTTIATLASQTSFTLTAGSSDNDAYGGATIVVVDASTSVQKAFGSLSAYVGSSKTVTLAQNPGIFTMAVGDTVYVLPSDVFAIWDRELKGNTHNVSSSGGRRLRGLQDFGNYLGQVHIDTVNGTAGVVPDENGTVNNPVLTMADALTLNAILGFNSFDVENGSDITLTSDSTNFTFTGGNYTIRLGGQIISGIRIVGSNFVTGEGTDGGAKPRFEDSLIDDVTLPPMEMIRCCLMGTVTASAAGEYFMVRCHSVLSGALIPVFDFGAAIGNVKFVASDFHEGLELRNINSTGSDEFTITGQGHLIYAASSSGVVEQYGDWRVVNTGGVTITEDDNTKNLATVLAGAFDPATQAVNVDRIGGSTAAATRLSLSANQIIPFTVDNTAFTPTSVAFEVDDITEATADHFNDRIIIWSTGSLAGQATSITDYQLVSGRGRFTVVGMTEAPANDDTGIII